MKQVGIPYMVMTAPCGRRKSFQKLIRRVKHKSGRANEDYSSFAFLTNTENGTYFIFNFKTPFYFIFVNLVACNWLDFCEKNCFYLLKLLIEIFALPTGNFSLILEVFKRLINQHLISSPRTY